MSMRSKAFIGGATVAVLLLVGAAAYAIDTTNSGKVADGVKVAGTPVGGLNREQAIRRLQKDIQKPLESDIGVKIGSRKFRLNPAEDVDLELDVSGMADEAVKASRQGWFLPRAFRDVTGGKVQRDLPIKLAYSRRKLNRWVKGTEARVELPPRDAALDLSGSSLGITPARDGIEVNGRSLKKQVIARLERPEGGRAVDVRAKVTKPEVTAKELPAKYPFVLTVDRGSKKLRVWKRLKEAKTYNVAVGAIGYDTPAGLYNIQDKQVNPTWRPPASKWVPKKLQGKAIPPGPGNPIKARWMGIAAGAGIHGTDDIGSLGTAASHGCIRMAIPDVVELYDQVPVGAPIYIG